MTEPVQPDYDAGREKYNYFAMMREKDALREAIDAACEPLRARIAELEKWEKDVSRHGAEGFAEWERAEKAESRARELEGRPSLVSTVVEAYEEQLAAYRAFRAAYEEWDERPTLTNLRGLEDARRKVEEVDP